MLSLTKGKRGSEFGTFCSAIDLESEKSVSML